MNLINTVWPTIPKLQDRSLHMRALIPEVHRPILLFFENVEARFKQVFNSLRRSDSFDYMCETVAREIRQFTGKKTGGATIKSFYYGYSDSKYSTVKLISKWLDSKENISSLDNNAE
ncbi:unnamed protein product [Rhizophagus irregularis]|nr:unnamed protein product [Rhizophagus irregularis]